MIAGQTVNQERGSVACVPGGREIVIEDDLVAVVEVDVMSFGLFVDAVVRPIEARQRLQVPGRKQRMGAEFAGFAKNCGVPLLGP